MAPSPPSLGPTGDDYLYAYDIQILEDRLCMQALTAPVRVPRTGGWDGRGRGALPQTGTALKKLLLIPMDLFASPWRGRALCREQKGMGTGATVMGWEAEGSHPRSHPIAAAGAGQALPTTRKVPASAEYINYLGTS